MRFESRELKPYAEPVAVDALREGSVYFAVNFVDEQMLIPTMETVVFVGRNLQPDDEDQVYFQDIGSFMDGVQFESATDDDNGIFFSATAKDVNHIFDFEHALDQLLACALRRRSNPEPALAASNRSP